MPAEKNHTLRLLAPIIVALGAVAVVIAISVNATITPAQRPAPADAPAAEESPGQVMASNGAAQSADDGDAQGDTSPDDPPAAQPEAQAAQPLDAPPTTDDPPTQTAPAESVIADAGDAPIAASSDPGLHARIWPALDAPLSSIGSLDPESGYELLVDFTLAGAGVESIRLTNHYETWRRDEQYTLQQRAVVANADGSTSAVASLAARGIIINGDFVELFSLRDGPRWRPTGQGAFEALVVDEAQRPIARLTREYQVRPGSFEIFVTQRVDNLTSEPLEAQWFQYGPIDLPPGETGYGGDKRRFFLGHLLSPEDDPSRQFVTSTGFTARNSILQRIRATIERNTLLWPAGEESRDQPAVWAALTNRYFAFAVHTPLGADIDESVAVDKAFTQAAQVFGVALGVGATETLAIQLTGPAFTIEAGSGVDLDVGAYAGPLWRKTLKAQPLYRVLRLDLLVVYNFGGPCAFCTFQWLAKFLIAFLGMLHDNLVFDWALAIMILVVCVRAALHPITKKSQIGLQRFGKQMQALAPKQQKIREKYKSDPKKMQQELQKLFREEGVSFTGAFGCLPMFLQSPIWIALYAMLYFAFDLRHEAAFFGLFQNVTGGAWSFLGDLSAPDRFIDFGRTIVTIPLLGEISSFNILPLLLGFVFFFQQKYLTPPPSATMTPEQQTQQKIMRVMFVVFFPLIMYNAPSGLSVYFMTNSVLGIIESRYIRSHVDQMDLEGPKKKAPRKKVANTAASPFGAAKGKTRQRESSPYKSRDRRK